MTKNLKQNILEIAGIVILMIVITSVLVMVCGASPLDAFALFIRGVFGTSASFAEVFVKACPLILTSLGCAVAFQTGFFNIGAEGQFYVGAMIGTIVAPNSSSLDAQEFVVLVATFFPLRSSREWILTSLPFFTTTCLPV